MTIEEAAYQDCKKSGFNNTNYAGHCIQSFINGANYYKENSNINSLNFENDALKREIQILKHQFEKIYTQE